MALDMIVDGVRYRKLDKNSKLDQDIAKQIEQQLHEQENDREQEYMTEFGKKVNELKPEKNSYYLTRIVILRYMAFIYLVAFLVAYHQNVYLMGKNGLLPANKFMDNVYKRFLSAKTPNQKHILQDFSTTDLFNKLRLFLNVPTLFWFFNWSQDIDWLLNSTALAGITLSGFVFVKGSANSIIMLALWLLYHSIINIGQTWYSFGWESQVVESGFIAVFLVPFLSLKQVDAKSPPSIPALYIYRWLISRIMLGAGLIKLRGDKCWLDLTCMNYHYETQPVPNPLSYYMHKEPELMHKFEVLANHFIELIAPLFIILPNRTFRNVGGFIQIFFQLVLIMSGNLSFLNWLTILPCLACFDDHSLSFLFSKSTNSSLWNVLKIQYLKSIKQSRLNFELNKKSHKIKSRIKLAINILFGALVAYLSMPVVLNLVSSNQVMNTSFEPFRLVNTYGAFGSVTKKRNEVIFKGTESEKLIGVSEKDIVWREYEFKCKPGNLKRRPCVISPYHYRLDWLMWFAAFQTYEQNPWLLSLSAKFLYNDKTFTSNMIAYNPFAESDKGPRYVKADLYRYTYIKLNSNSTGWWKRKFVRSYLPPIGLTQIKAFISDLGWEE